MDKKTHLRVNVGLAHEQHHAQKGNDLRNGLRRGGRAKSKNENENTKNTKKGKGS